MAYYHARSGATRSDALVSGLYTRSIYLSVGGTDRTPNLIKDGSTWTWSLDETPAQATIATRQFTPAMFAEVRIYNGGTKGVLLFRGRVLGITSRAAREAVQPMHTMTVVGPHWLLDRYARVTKRYRSQGANAIIADILTTATNGDFTVGSIPSTLGNIDAMDFTDELVSRALMRVARAVSAVVVIDPQHRVSLTATTFPDGNALTVAASTRGYWDFVVEQDGAQTRTRSIYEGGGSAATAVVSPGASTIPVDNTTWYGASGGMVRVNQSTVTYTGKSTESGPGDLTGCTGIAYDIMPGEPVNVMITTNDTTAQTTMATALGGGLSGIVVDVQQDGRLSRAECTGRSTADLAFLSGVITSVSYTTDNEFTTVGKMVAVSVTKPVTVSASFRVQSVTMRPRGRFDSSTAEWMFDVVASPFRRTLPALIQDVDTPK